MKSHAATRWCAIVWTMDRLDCDDAAARWRLGRTRLGAVLLEREMGSRSVIVIDVRRKHLTQMALVENDQYGAAG
jgi:hypothetical protein